MSQDKSKFWLKYLVIPIELIAHSELNLMDGAVFSVIDILDHPEKGCYARNKFIAKLLLVSPSTINNSIQRLKQYKFISSNGKRDDDRILKVNSLYKQEHENILKNYYRGYEDFNNPLIKNLIRYNNIKDNILSKDNRGGTAEAGALGMTDTDALDPTGGYRDFIKNKLPIKGKRTKFTPVKQHHRINPLIEYWNNLSHTRKHKDPSSKIYKQCSSMIRQLKQGTLNKNIFDSEWVQKYKIKTDHLLRGYSDKEIKQGFDNLALVYVPGYWPQHKSWIKELSLADLIYNPRAQNSWFLARFIEPPKLLSKQLLDFQQGKDPMPDVTKKFKEYFGYEDSDVVQLLKKLNIIVKFYKSLPKKIFECGDFADFCPNEKKFCLHYLKYLKQCNYQFMWGKTFQMYLDKHWDENSNALRKKLSTFLK